MISLRAILVAASLGGAIGPTHIPRRRRILRGVPIPPPEDGPIRVADTPGRNSPCPCESGKKYKRCCGREG